MWLFQYVLFSNCSVFILQSPLNFVLLPYWSRRGITAAVFFFPVLLTFYLYGISVIVSLLLFMKFLFAHCNMVWIDRITYKTDNRYQLVKFYSQPTCIWFHGMGPFAQIAFHPYIPLVMSLFVLFYSILKQTHNATLWTMCNISFVFQTISTKLGICVYNYICNKMASANKVNFQKYFWEIALKACWWNIQFHEMSVSGVTNVCIYDS